MVGQFALMGELLTVEIDGARQPEAGRHRLRRIPAELVRHIDESGHRQQVTHSFRQKGLPPHLPGFDGDHQDDHNGGDNIPPPYLPLVPFRSRTNFLDRHRLLLSRLLVPEPLNVVGRLIHVQRPSHESVASALA
jgi:hypothetical protein